MGYTDFLKPRSFRYMSPEKCQKVLSEVLSKFDGFLDGVSEVNGADLVDEITHALGRNAVLPSDEDYLGLRSYVNGKIRLYTWDTNHRMRNHSQMYYMLYVGDDLAFHGDDFFCSPQDTLDSDETFSACALSLAYLEPSEDELAEYTEEQLAYLNSSLWDEFKMDALTEQERLSAQRGGGSSG